MFFDLLGGRRDRLLFICQTMVPALIILITTVSCSGPPANLPPPIAEIVELFSGTETPKQQLVQRDDAQPKIRRPPSKKTSAPPTPDAQRQQQLYQEFLEWRKNQRDQRLSSGTTASTELGRLVDRTFAPAITAHSAKTGFSTAPSQNKQIIDCSQSENDDPNSERRYRPAARVENEEDDTGSQK